MMKFVHLHCHDEYSVLDGLGKPSQYAEEAKRLGFEYLAMTNHGNVDGNIVFQKACEKEGVIPIHGCEFYIVQDINGDEEERKKEKRKHILVFAKNQIGWENILKMLTIANIDGYYRRPRIDPKILLKHSEGLVISAACASSYITEDWGYDLFLKLLKIQKDDVYLEIMPHKYDMQEKVNDLFIGLSEKHDVKLIATNDCHYPTIDGEMTQEVLLAIQTKKKWKDPTRWKFDVKGLYLKTKREMVEAFKNQTKIDKRIFAKALVNTLEIAEKCKDFRIKDISIKLPIVPGFEGRDQNECVRDACIQGFKKKIESYPEKVEKIDLYNERLEEELDLIFKQGFSEYFMIVWELVRWCKKNDIMVGPGRGSAGGSLVCYVMDITNVDPIQYDLVFARFISPARIDLPDIDMDFEDRKRHMIREHLEEIYGEYSVAGVSTFLSMKGKGSVRDASRVFDIPLVDVNKACDSIVTRSGGDARSDYSIEDAFETFEDGKKFKKKYPKVAEIAMKLEGQIRGKGQHAAAIVIADHDLRDGTKVNLVNGKDGDYCVNWDKHDIENQGLMKLDVLGLNSLTILNEARRLIKENHNIDIDYYKIEPDDPRCFEEFSKGNNIGCFQVGSLGLRKFCIQFGVENFEMLVNATSLFRPGTLRSGMTTEFVLRKHKEKEWSFPNEFIKNITKDTYGIILYQEQVMQFMYDLAGLPWRTADTVRKVISKSQGQEMFAKFKDLFVEGCIKKKTLNRDEASKLWDSLASFGSYGFNKSHAVEYSYITYWDMWTKVYYPNEFITAKLTYGQDDKKDEIIEEAHRLGLDIRPPKVGISDSHKWIVKNSTLYCPFIEIKGLGEKTVKKIVEELYKEKKSSSDGFFKDDKKSKINSKYRKILDDINSFEDVEFTDDEAEKCKDYFKFSLVKDRSRKFRKIKEIIEKTINIKNISESDPKTSKNEEFYFGQMTEIKFGYRSAVQKNSKDYAGVKDNLGGVYGNFKDESDFRMLVFDQKIYAKKKEFVEHSADKFMLAKANIPSRAGNFMCHDLYGEEELYSCNLKGLKLDAFEKKRFVNKNLSECKNCQFSENCKKPVLPKKGKYNGMIIYESPSAAECKEEELGKGYNEYILKYLEDNGIDKRAFTISSVIKCNVGSKKVGKRDIAKCSNVWLKEEIENIQPIHILAVGNVGVGFFEEEPKGIMDKNGKTFWNHEYGCWVSYVMNPKSMSYGKENKELIDKGLKNFVRKCKYLGINKR